MTPDVLLPASWYPHEMQAELLAAGIKTLVSTDGLSAALGYNVPTKTPMAYVPAFGGTSLRNVYEATGGNPIANYPRQNMCIIVTPTIAKFSYSKTIHGVPLHIRDFIGDEDEEDEDMKVKVSSEKLDTLVCVEPGHLPPGFRENAQNAMRIAVDTVRAFTNQHFDVVGCKLSPLTSGKGNIAMFLHFAHGCPFSKQEFFDSNVFDEEMRRMIQIRVIPNPVVTRFDEPQSAVKFSIKFVAVDRVLFNKAFPLLQHAIGVAFKGANLRFIKPLNKTNELSGLVQVPEKASDANLAKFAKDVAKINYNPYIYISCNAENTTVE